MSNTREALNKILGSREEPASDSKAAAISDEIAAAAAAPKEYRAFKVGDRVQMGFSVIEKDGTAHSFPYHQLRYTKHWAIDGQEYLSAVCSGMAIVMRGKGLHLLLHAMQRCAVPDIREWDGVSPLTNPQEYIDRLEVKDPKDAEQDRPKPQLVSKAG